MKGFRKLVVLGLFLVTLLLVIDIIHAGKKEPKKKELENQTINMKENSKNGKVEKLKKKESFKHERNKRSDNSVNSEDPKNFSEEPKFESKKYKVKKAAKYTSTEGRSAENNVNPKYTKSNKKVKKYQVFNENEAAQEIMRKGKKSKGYISKTQNLDEKKSQKRTLNEKVKVQEADEERNQVYEENVDDEANGLKRKKYKLVEVVLEEDAEEEKEGNETYIEVGSEDDVFGENEEIEREEIVDKLRKSETYVVTKSKRPDIAHPPVDDYPHEESSSEEYNQEETTESGYSEDPYPSIESQPQQYDDQSSQISCRPLPEDPNRVGPKKLVLYVIEEEVNGQIKKRVVSEEDGVTMCEVADLMKEHYYAGLL